MAILDKLMKECGLDYSDKGYDNTAGPRIHQNHPRYIAIQIAYRLGEVRQNNALCHAPDRDLPERRVNAARKVRAPVQVH